MKIGTRGSPLALAQASETREPPDGRPWAWPKTDIEIVVITTTGDRIRDRPLSEIGGKGLFTKEIEEALFAGSIDLAVHSMKDMPARLPDGLVMAALLPREDARDAFLSPVAKSIDDLPKGAIVGSSSVRRAAQLKRLRPDLEVIQFRGNVETRLQQAGRGRGRRRPSWPAPGSTGSGSADRITAPFPSRSCCPPWRRARSASRSARMTSKTRDLLAAINHETSAIAVDCERAFLAALDGSCRTPLAGHAIIEGWTDDVPRPCADP